MKTVVLVLTVSLMACSKPAPKMEFDSFGKGITMEAPMPLADAVSKLPTLMDKDVVVDGAITEVCQAKGCWMKVQDGQQEVRVTFENYGFFVPKDAAGKKVRIQGKIMEKEISQDEARHYLEDAGKPKEEIEKIVGPQKGLTMIATGVAIVK